MPRKPNADYSIYDSFDGIDTNLDISKEFADEVDEDTEFNLPHTEDPIEDFYKQYNKKSKPKF